MVSSFLIVGLATNNFHNQFSCCLIFFVCCSQDPVFVLRWFCPVLLCHCSWPSTNSYLGAELLHWHRHSLAARSNNGVAPCLFAYCSTKPRTGHSTSTDIDYTDIIIFTFLYLLFSCAFSLVSTGNDLVTCIESWHQCSMLGSYGKWSTATTFEGSFACKAMV